MEIQSSPSKMLGLDGFVVDAPIIGSKDGLSLIAHGQDGEFMIYERHAFEDLDWECPYCGKSVRLVMLDSTDRMRARDPDMTMMGVDEKNYDKYAGMEIDICYLVAECPRESCKRKLFVTVHWVAGIREIAEVYPYPNVRADSFPDSIPAKIREDFAEASRCHGVTAYKAVVVMCRRVIQDIAHQEKIEGRDPSEQIKEMFAKKLITKHMFDTAQHVNQFGVFGAHPQDDGLDKITPNLTSRVLEVTYQILPAMYVLSGDNKIFNRHIQQAKQPKALPPPPMTDDEDIPF